MRIFIIIVLQKGQCNWFVLVQLSVWLSGMPLKCWINSSPEGATCWQYDPDRFSNDCFPKFGSIGYTRIYNLNYTIIIILSFPHLFVGSIIPTCFNLHLAHFSTFYTVASLYGKSSFISALLVKPRRTSIFTLLVEAEVLQTRSTAWVI